MVQGEKFLHPRRRWRENRRGDLSAILAIPVDITNNQFTQGSAPAMAQTPFHGASTAPGTSGLGTSFPAMFGNQFNTAFTHPLPRVPLRELLTPLRANDLPAPKSPL